MNEPLLSICIPTYNRANYLKDILASIFVQFDCPEMYNQVEVLVSDNAGNDNTEDVVMEYQKKYKNLFYFKNEINVGLSKNLIICINKARGLYAWSSGDDDLFLEGSIKHVLSSIKNNPGLGLISVNYSQYSEKEEKYICLSMFDKLAINPKKNDLIKDLLFNNGKEYFSFFNDAPSFFPSTIMLRSIWISTNVNDYVGTCFEQYATVLLNINKIKILTISKPLIRGLIPTNGWQSDGNKLFSIQLGAMKVRELVFRDSRNPFPRDIFLSMKKFYLKNFLRVVIASTYYSFKLTKENIEDLKFIYGKNIYYFYFLPILKIVKITPRKFIKLMFFIKRSLYKK